MVEDLEGQAKEFTLHFLFNSEPLDFFFSFIFSVPSCVPSVTLCISLSLFGLEWRSRESTKIYKLNESKSLCEEETTTKLLFS